MSYAEAAARGPKQTPEEVRVRLASPDAFYPSTAGPFLRPSLCLVYEPARPLAPQLPDTTSPPQAAAPQLPQIEPSETASHVSLIDVDAPSVRTVPSDFMDSDVQTDTQAARIEREEVEEAARAEADLAKKRPTGGKSSGKATAADARASVRRADAWIAGRVASLGDTTSTLLVLTNLVAVTAVSSLLGMGGWAAYERGRLGWKSVGVGLSVVGAVALVESGFAR